MSVDCSICSLHILGILIGRLIQQVAVSVTQKRNSPKAPREAATHMDSSNFSCSRVANAIVWL